MEALREAPVGGRGCRNRCRGVWQGRSGRGRVREAVERDRRAFLMLVDRRGMPPGVPCRAGGVE